MSVSMGVSSEPEGPSGYTYAAVLARVSGPEAREEVLGTLLGLRFSGWVAPPEHGWLTLVPAGEGTVAAGRRGVVGLGEALAGTAVAIRVRDDRQLVLVAWESGREVARYVSDPSLEPGADEDVLPDPFGAEDADALAAACGRPDAGEELGDLLADPLDPEEEIESERLGRVLRLLGLPTWVVTSWRLPRAMPTGPTPRELLRLGAGRTGLPGRLAGTAASLGRCWRPPPPVLDDPPRGGPGRDDDLAMWL